MTDADKKNIEKLKISCRKNGGYKALNRLLELYILEQNKTLCEIIEIVRMEIDQMWGGEDEIARICAEPICDGYNI